MTRTGPDTWAGDVFPGLAWQMAHGKAGEYQLVAHQWKQEACTIRAWVTDDGHVAPLEISLDADGNNRLLPWLETSAARSGACLGPSQHADLRGLWDPGARAIPTKPVGQLEMAFNG